MEDIVYPAFIIRSFRDAPDRAFIFVLLFLSPRGRQLVARQVTLVKWNEPYQKLASCDSSGVIFVWIKYEGRWSIELINDRNTQVTDFAWSHDGRMALICYRDGFVLVGSVAGQRYWSSTLHLDRAAVLCGIWTPDDHQERLRSRDDRSDLETVSTLGTPSLCYAASVEPIVDRAGPSTA
ncbi:hypothetical protein HPB50_003189 [Hyalomma asiaticum]|uniref:Uncharacterized protein n=1 Tax=Hyalomma asiaticum TaxID=266040 RepID=A0ACB7S3N8_HYAAI|nr:hypothetical protein HPB50_003189 [Hyalomma asiaticum]